MSARTDATMYSEPVSFRKTKMCKFFAAGKCLRSTGCTWAHGQEELQPLPDFSRTRICPDLRDTGYCQKGNACSFAHAPEELRARTRGHAQVIGDMKRLLEANSGFAPQQTRNALAFETPSARPDEVAASAVQNPQQAVAAAPVLLPGQIPLRMQVYILMPCNAAAVVPGNTPPGQTPVETPPEPEAKGREVDLFDVSCDKAGDDDLDLPENSWSRQSTEEPSGGPLEDFYDDFEDDNEEDQPLDQSDSLLDTSGGCAEVEIEHGSCHVAATQLGVTEVQKDNMVTSAGRELSSLASACGLAFAMKNSFLNFVDIDAEVGPVRRTRSLGDLPVGSPA